MKSRESLKRMTMSGFLAGLVTLTTAYILHIPYGSNGGYIHVGDGFIYLAASLLPTPYALVVAMIGGGLADLLTAPAWMIPTILIKGSLVLFFTAKSDRLGSRRNRIAPFFALLVSVFGYYIAEGVLFGSFTAAIPSITGNVIQGIGSGILFYVMIAALDQIHFKQKIGLKSI